MSASTKQKCSTDGIGIYILIIIYIYVYNIYTYQRKPEVLKFYHAMAFYFFATFWQLKNDNI